MTAPTLVGPLPVGGGPVVSHEEPVQYLTDRELQVLRLAANGTTNRQIGRQLGTCEDTVKTQIRAILRKLRADDRAQAVAIAMCLGLISATDINVPRDVAHVLSSPRKDTAA